MAGVTSILEIFGVLHMDWELIRLMSILNINSFFTNNTTGNVRLGVTLRRLRERQLSLSVKIGCLYVWLSYLTSIAHVLQCSVIHGLSGSTILLHITSLLSWKIFLWTYMCDLIFSTNFVWNKSHSKLDLAKYCHVCTSVVVKRACYSFQILITTWIFDRDFLKVFRHQL
jgi:hypothetical protein